MNVIEIDGVAILEQRVGGGQYTDQPYATSSHIVEILARHGGDTNLGGRRPPSNPKEDLLHQALVVLQLGIATITAKFQSLQDNLKAEERDHQNTHDISVEELLGTHFALTTLADDMALVCDLIVVATTQHDEVEHLRVSLDLSLGLQRH